MRPPIAERYRAARRLLPWAHKAAFSISDQVVISGCNMVLTVLLARNLAPEQYGVYVLAFAILLLVSDLHQALLLEPLSVLGAADYSERLGPYLGAVLWLHAILSSLVALVMLAAAGLVSLAASGAPLSRALAGAAVAAPMILLFWLARSACYVTLRPARAAAGAFVYAAVVLGAVAVLGARLTPFTAFLVMAAAALAVAILVLAGFRPALRPARHGVPVRQVWHSHFRYGRWALGAGAVDWVISQASVLITGAFLGLRDLAGLRAVTNLLMPLNHLGAAMHRIMQPVFSRTCAAEGSHALARPVYSLALLFAAGAAFYSAALAAGGTQLMTLVYGPKFNGYAHLIVWLAIGTIGSVAAQVFAVGLRAMQAPSQVFTAHLISGTIFIAVAIPATLAFGLAGVAAALALAGLLTLASAAALFWLRVEPPGCGSPLPRVAWVIPSLARGFYWQPVFREFSAICPEHVVFTGIWPGYIRSCESAFRVSEYSAGTVVRAGRWKFIWSSPVLLLRLLRYRPSVIFTGAFHLATLFAIAAKILLRARLILLWDGVSSEVLDVGRARLGIRRWLARRVDYGITNTHEGLEYLASDIGIPRTRLLHHPYQVPDSDVLCAKPAQGGSDDFGQFRRPVFLYAGELLLDKGLLSLFDACRILQERGYREFSCVLVGSGEHEQQLRALAREKGVDSHLHWIGRVDYHRLGEYYRECDVFVFPSLHDVWGMVVLEAMLFGKPVLCSRFSGSRELIRDGENGYVFDPRRPGELADHMARFISEPALAERIGAAAGATMARYTPRRAAAVLAGAISRL